MEIYEVPLEVTFKAKVTVRASNYVQAKRLAIELSDYVCSSSMTNDKRLVDWELVPEKPKKHISDIGPVYRDYYLKYFSIDKNSENDFSMNLLFRNIMNKDEIVSITIISTLQDYNTFNSIKELNAHRFYDIFKYKIQGAIDNHIKNKKL